MTDVRIYDRALSSNEVSALYTLESTPPTPSISFTTNGSNLTVSSCTLGGTVVIPANTNGLAVTSIGNGAFQNNKNVTSIVIPNGVTSIGLNAFAGCTALTNITLPNSIITIGASSFSNCPNLSIINTSDDLMRYLAENQSALGLNQQAINNFVPKSPRAWNQWCSANQTNQYSSLSNGLVAYYPFHGDYNDYSGNGNGLIFANDAILTNNQFGEPNSAYHFDGSANGFITSNTSVRLRG